MDKADLQNWMREDLEKSEISYEVALELGFKCVTAEEASELVGMGVHSDGYIIPYLDPATSEPVTDETGNPHIRLKLRKPTGNAKYLSPRRGGQHAFITGKAHAALINKDTTMILTEGEKKALKATLDGIPCIGLPGNFGFLRQDGLLPELEPYAIAGRDWYVIWDSDAAFNRAFAASTQKLASLLAQRQIGLKIVILRPGSANEKVGLDDYLAANSVTDFWGLISRARKTSGYTTDEIYIAGIIEHASLLAGLPVDVLKKHADDFLRKGYFEDIEKTTRSTIDQCLEKRNKPLFLALKAAVDIRLRGEFQGVQPAENGGKSLAAKKYVRIAGSNRIVKIERVDHDIVYCFIDKKEYSSRPYPRRMLELVDGPSMSAINGLLGGRPKGPSSTDIADGFLDQPSVTQNGVKLYRHYHQDFIEYTGKGYRRVPPGDMKSRITGFMRGKEEFKNYITEAAVKNTMLNLCGEGQLHVPSYTSLPCRVIKNEFEPLNDCIVLANGVVHVDTLVTAARDHIEPPDSRILTPASPEIISLNALPVIFDSKAECPRFLKYLREVQPSGEGREMLQMLAGLLLVPKTTYNVLFMLYGQGGTGKSVYIHIMQKLLGDHNVCNIPLREMQEKHKRHLLTETLACLVEEDETELNGDRGTAQAEGLIKTFTGGGMVQCEPKFKNSYSAPATARGVYSMNNLPSFADRTNGLWDRLRIIPFEQVIRDTKQDNKHLKEDLAATELPGIFMWALRGLVKLMLRGSFPDHFTDRKEVHRLSLDHEREFLTAHAREKPDGFVPTMGIYGAYYTWMKARNYHPRGTNKFASAITRCFPCAEKTTRKTGGERKSGYAGIEWDGEAEA